MIPTPRLEELRDLHAGHAQDWADVKAAPMALEALDTAMALEELIGRRKPRHVAVGCAAVAVSGFLAGIAGFALGWWLA